MWAALMLHVDPRSRAAPIVGRPGCPGRVLFSASAVGVIPPRFTAKHRFHPRVGVFDVSLRGRGSRSGLRSGVVAWWHSRGRPPMSVTQSGCDVATAREQLYSDGITAL